MSDRPPAPYPVAWAKIRQAQRRVAIGWFAFVGFMLLFGSVVPRHSPMRRLLIVPFIFGLGVTLAYFATLRCPHCGERIMFRGRLNRVGPDSATLREGRCSRCGTQIDPPKS